MNTQQEELETLEQMGREVCGTCEGAKVFRQLHYQEVFPNSIQMAVDSLETCPDCSGTGRKWPGFSRNQGTDPRSPRVPVTIAEAVLWGMALENFRYLRKTWSLNHERWEYRVRFEPPFGQGDVLWWHETPALALFAAMKEME